MNWSIHLTKYYSVFQHLLIRGSHLPPHALFPLVPLRFATDRQIRLLKAWRQLIAEALIWEIR